MLSLQSGHLIFNGRMVTAFILEFDLKVDYNYHGKMSFPMSILNRVLTLH